MKFKVIYRKAGKKLVYLPSSNKKDHNPPSNNLKPDTNPIKKRKRALRMMVKRETRSRAVEMTRKNKKEMTIVTGIRLRNCRDSRRSS